MEEGLIKEVKLRIERSQGALRSAEALLNEKEYGDSISRSYYAMFHMAKALVLCEGKGAKTHKGLLSLFGQEFVKTGEIEKHVGNLIKELHDLCVVAPEFGKDPIAETALLKFHTWDIDPCIEVIPYSPTDLAVEEDPLACEIMKYGKEIKI